MAVAWILTVVALLEAASEEEATVEMNSENAVALRAVAEVVEASIIEIILTVATTKIRTITLASPQEAEALAGLRGPVASTSLTILRDSPWALVEVATQVSGKRKIDLR